MALLRFKKHHKKITEELFDKKALLRATKASQTRKNKKIEKQNIRYSLFSEFQEEPEERFSEEKLNNIVEEKIEIRVKNADVSRIERARLIKKLRKEYKENKALCEAWNNSGLADPQYFSEFAKKFGKPQKKKLRIKSIILWGVLPVWIRIFTTRQKWEEDLYYYGVC